MGRRPLTQADHVVIDRPREAADRRGELYRRGRGKQGVLVRPDASIRATRRVYGSDLRRRLRGDHELLDQRSTSGLAGTSRSPAASSRSFAITPRGPEPMRRRGRGEAEAGTGFPIVKNSIYSAGWINPNRMQPNHTLTKNPDGTFRCTYCSEEKIPADKTDEHRATCQGYRVKVGPFPSRE
ncbi:MAG TPA: hypothetical protein VK932_26880 [Kofleriaceae bacterium]|nr:hypothetical protein [Kofleriaceae bacterium]